MDKCPYCGSDGGVYTTYTGKQFVDAMPFADYSEFTQITKLII